MSDRIAADFVITDAVIITMNENRDVLENGAIAIKDDRIVWVGAGDEFYRHVSTKSVLLAEGDVICPGFINNHVHTTGDPLTRHFMPDELGGADILVDWVLPRYFAHTPDDEKLSASLCAVELLKSGTTTFVEAGTIRHLDHAVEGFRQTGIRGRVGAWVEGRSYEPTGNPAALISDAIKTMEDEVRRYPSSQDDLIAAWPILVGHNTNPGEVWQAAKEIADANSLCVLAHMSPYQADPDWYLENTGMRPVEFLDSLGVLGKNTLLTHMTHMNESELDLLIQKQTSIVFCPFASLKGAFGVSRVSLYTQYLKAGGIISFATDGYDTEILQATRIGASLFKDLDQNTATITAMKALELITCRAAEAIGMADDIGSLQAGKKADFIRFNTKCFQWRPLLNPVAQLVWSADARSIRDVWVNGDQVISKGVSSKLDESQLLSSIQGAADSIIERANMPS